VVRAVLVVLVYGGLIAVLWRATNNPYLATDFIEYWTAARLNLTGQNAYDAAAVVAVQHEVRAQLDQSLMTEALQRSHGFDFNKPTLMYNPPWVLALVLPVGLLPYRVALMLWLIIIFLAVLICSESCWRLYGGSSSQRWVAWVLGLLFLPTMSSMFYGQISPLMLLGAVAFMWAVKDGRWGRAGLAASLLALKPQVVYLFWLAFILWVVQERRWRVLLIALAAGAVATAIPTTFNPSVLIQYVRAYAAQPPFFWAPAVPALALRLIFGADKTWLQFVPSVLGLIWLAWRWRAHRSSWQWEEQLPPLLLVSYVTASYGWTFDQVIFIPALMQAAVWILPNWRRRWPIWGSYLAVSPALTPILLSTPGFVVVWHPLALSILYWMARRAMTREATTKTYAQPAAA
jgi:Glycosyltransferase family 87